MEENGVRREDGLDEGVERLVALGRALSDPIRVRMLSMMADGRGCCDFSDSGVPADEGEEGICVCEFEEVFSMGQSKVSYHMKKLKDAGLVHEEDAGSGSSTPSTGRPPEICSARQPIGCSPDPRSGSWPVAAADTAGVAQRSRVLFLCTHNSARSQMAEGLLRCMAGDRFEAMSAGTEATRVRPLAIRAMGEIGIDISSQESKTLDRYLREPFDYVITVCDDANEACPFFPGATNRLHWSFEDPSRAEGSEEERLAVFRKVRDTLRGRIERELANQK